MLAIEEHPNHVDFGNDLLFLVYFSIVRFFIAKIERYVDYYEYLPIRYTIYAVKIECQ